MNNITINLKNVDEVLNTSSSPYEIWDSAVDSYEIWWDGFKAESFEEYRLEWNEDSPDIPRTLNSILTQWTTIKLHWLGSFYINEYFTSNYFQTLLEDIQLAVDNNKTSYEEALLLNGFVKCQQ